MSQQECHFPRQQLDLQKSKALVTGVGAELGDAKPVDDAFPQWGLLHHLCADLANQLDPCSIETG